MVRFVDLSKDYWTNWEDGDTGHPCCAFLSTTSDRFVSNDISGHVFDSAEEIDWIEDEAVRERCKALVPDGFWERTADYYKKADSTLANLSTMTEAQRVEFFEQLKSAYCEHCGCEQVGARCQCNNDN